jgi:hypothetical protein
MVPSVTDNGAFLAPYLYQVNRLSDRARDRKEVRRFAPEGRGSIEAWLAAPVRRRVQARSLALVRRPECRREAVKVADRDLAELVPLFRL